MKRTSGRETADMTDDAICSGAGLAAVRAMLLAAGFTKSRVSRLLKPYRPKKKGKKSKDKNKQSDAPKNDDNGGDDNEDPGDKEPPWEFKRLRRMKAPGT